MVSVTGCGLTFPFFVCQPTARNPATTIAVGLAIMLIYWTPLSK